MGARASRPPPWNRHRHIVKIVLRARNVTRQDFETSKTTYRTRYKERTLATRQRPSVISGTRKMHFLGHAYYPIFPPGVALRRL
jgi:hypothetical protein